MKQLLTRLVLLLWVSLPACSPPSPPSTSSATVRIRWARDPENLDPLVVDNSSAFEVANLLYCSLLKGNEQKQRFVPWLADSLPRVQRLGDSLLLVTYQLRAQATWDNGTPVLARDVAVTLKAMNCPGLPIEMAQATYGFIRDIRLDARDPKRFTLVCVGQSDDRLRSSGDFSILPEYILDPKGTLRGVALPSLRQENPAAVVQAFAARYRVLELARHPERLPGCGPYQLKAWQSGRYLTLQRKPSWWADSLPAPPPELRAFPTQITYQVIPDAATATLALRRGEIDLYSMVPAREFARMQQSATDRARLRFSTADSYEFVTANFNVRRSVLRNPLTRQALTHLFNVPALIQATQQGTAYPSAGLISPRIKAYYNDSLPLPDFNPKKAADLLRQAGWRRQVDGAWQGSNAAGKPERLQLAVSYRAADAGFETTALQFRAAAATLGIPVELRPTEQSVLSRQARAGETDMQILNLAGNPFSYDFTPLLHSKGIGAGNSTGFSNATNDRLIDAIVATDDATQKVRLLRKFQRLMAIERPFTVLYFLQYRVAAAQALGTVPVSGLKPGYEVTLIQPLKGATAR
ncbi:ABC transporter substrate-binding protein [Hymenobacter tenuis]